MVTGSNSSRRKNKAVPGVRMLSRRVLGYKLRAALVSLSVFLVFAVLLASITYFYWYPDYLFWLDGGIQGLRLVYAVDFVLGPLLALVFFHPDKSRSKLVFDVVFIALIQFAAMAWGAYQVYGQRPVAVVYGSQRFISVAPDIMELQRKSAEDFHVYSDSRPPYVYRRETTSEAEKRKQLAMLMRQGFHFESQAWLFSPFKMNLEHIFSRQTGIRRYLSSDMGQEWAAWASGRGAMEDYRFAFYEGRYGNAVLVFSPEGDYRGYLELKETVLPDLSDDGALAAKPH